MQLEADQGPDVELRLAVIAEIFRSDERGCGNGGGGEGGGGGDGGGGEGGGEGDGGGGEGGGEGDGGGGEGAWTHCMHWGHTALASAPVVWSVSVQNSALEPPLA